MARRYSTAEKAKWSSKSPAPVRRAPIPIPASNNSDLIEQNKLSLIGRVTNPAAQNTRALVEFFLQHWHVSGSITGRDLGPQLFQFFFESEKDLQSILNKAPYHFKRWMILLQRWEPVVSDSFPSTISFWIRIHGIPLHYWTEGALHAIGSELGLVVTKEVNKGRIRVLINGLRPLEKRLEISLPSGEIKEVEVEYEQLDKHCFSCSSLSHDQDHCPSRSSKAEAPMDINQMRTLEKLADRRRTNTKAVRYDDRPGSYQQRSYHGNEDRHAGYSRSNGNHVPRSSHRPMSSEYRRLPPASPPRRAEEHKKETWVPRKDQTSGSVAGLDPRASGRLSVRTSRQNPSSQISHTPSPRPARDPIRTISETGSDQALSKERRSALERISPAASLMSSERRPARERLSLPPVMESLPHNEEVTTDSRALQEVEIRYFEEMMGDQPFTERNGASGSKLPQAVPSPIRTLSEDRRHVSLRLGPIPAEPEVTISLPLEPPPKRSGRLAAKASGKRKAPEKTNRSPLQGVGIKKRRVTKTHPSPKRRLALPLDSTKPGTKTGKAAPRMAPAAKVFPSSKKKVADFRPPQDPLP